MDEDGFDWKNLFWLEFGVCMRGKTTFCVVAIMTVFTGTFHLRGADGIKKENYDWWRKARFGIFIHWNPSSLLALGAGSWQRDKGGGRRGVDPSINKSVFDKPPPCVSDAEFEKAKKRYYGSFGAHAPMELYDNLFWRFNPVKFDAGKWARFFKECGAGYVVLITKHHDGFCMWDSKVTKYDIMSTPFKRDIFGELAKACQDEGIKVLCYYSVADWYEKSFNPKNPAPYREFMEKQISELCEYPVSGFWWDGGNACGVDPNRIWNIIKKKIKAPILNGRGINIPGIKFGTPEQKLGSFDRTKPWESCVTMGGEGWFWNGGRNMMSPASCIHLLVSAAIGDGNLLLDFGPKETGEMPEEAVRNYKAMGAWLKKYGESIYGTRGGPYKPGLWGGSTCAGKNIYLHITQIWPGGVLKLKPLPVKIIKATTLTGGTSVVTQDPNALTIKLDPAAHKRPDTIIKLEIDGNAFDMPPFEGMEPRLVSLDSKVSASSNFRAGVRGAAQGVTIYKRELNRKAAKYYGEDVGGKIESNRRLKLTPEEKTRCPWLTLPRGHIWRYWMSKDSDKQPWIELDMGEQKTFNYIYLLEKFNRIDAYRVQCQNASGQWVDIHKGGEMETAAILLPKPIAARKVRVVVDKWTRGNHPDEKGGAGIREFDLWFDPLNAE